MVKWLGDPFIFKGHGTKECLECVHVHVYEPFYVYIWKGWVFHHYIDKYSKFGYVDMKSGAMDKLIEFKVELDKLLHKHIKALWLDRGGLFSKFDSFHMEHEIISQSCAPRTTLQNGVMKRRYWTLINKVRSVIIEGKNSDLFVSQVRISLGICITILDLL